MSTTPFVNASNQNVLDITGKLRMRPLSSAAQQVQFFDDGGVNSVDIQAPSTVASTTYKLPAAAPAVGGLSLLSDTAGNMSWGNPAAVGSFVCLDASNVDISSSIVNVWNTATQVSQAIGTCVEYTAARDISNGTVCITEISGGKVMAANPQSFQTGAEYEKLIGVALEDASAGSVIKILEEGYCTVRGDPVVGLSGNILLTSPPTGTSGNTFGVNNSAIRFQDSGGSGGSYGNNANLNVTFDAGPGFTIKIIIDASSSWQFEFASTAMYDRLGFTTSQNGTSFTNGPNIIGMEQSATPTAPWSDSFSPDPSGYIFPEAFDGAIPFLSQNPIPNDNGQQMDLSLVNGGTPKVYDLGARYAKFYFRSDFGTTLAGWNFIISSNNIIGVNFPTNGLLYLSSYASGPSAPYSTVTSQNSTGGGIGNIALGYTLGANTSDTTQPYIFARVHDR